jgi:hypothetical protein
MLTLHPDTTLELIADIHREQYKHSQRRARRPIRR